MCRNLQDFNKLNPSFMKNIFAVKKQIGLPENNTN